MLSLQTPLVCSNIESEKNDWKIKKTGLKNQCTEGGKWDVYACVQQNSLDPNISDYCSEDLQRVKE